MSDSIAANEAQINSHQAVSGGAGGKGQSDSSECGVQLVRGSRMSAGVWAASQRLTGWESIRSQTSDS